MISAAWAHGGEVYGGLAGAWTLDPLVLVPLALAAALYWRGALRAGAREACFAGGMAALFLALVWPLDALGERLFSAHMAQHLALMNVAAPLLVLGAPLAAMLRALPLGARRALARLGAARGWRAGWRWLSALAVATALQQAVLWAWHTPRAIAAALESDAVHIAMHASLLAAALVFWSAVLRPASGRYWGSIAALLVTFKISGIVCIGFLLQTEAVYEAYRNGVDDEHLGWGLMMGIGTLSWLGAAVALTATSLARLERAHPGNSPR